MTTIFTKIIRGEIPAQFVYEDDVCVVVMDKFPAVEGQSLVIPRIEVDYIFDLSEDIFNHIFNVAKMVAKSSDKAFATSRTCVVVEGFEVPHVHIKLYPMGKDDKNLGAVITQTKEKSDEELIAKAQQIKDCL